MLDSFDIVSLVTSLEETYGFIIDALDILPENFCSAEAIANFIRKNRSGR
jgi:acyl carrier protein